MQIFCFLCRNICVYRKKAVPLPRKGLQETKMPSTDVQNMIPQIREYLATQPVERAYLFGSCSRGEERPDSDVDILVALDHSKPIGMRYFQMITDLEDKLGRTVDLVTEDGLKSYARPYVNHDKIMIYERAH